MNEIDDYDFRSVDISNLTSIFGNEDTLNIGDTNLAYKAPKPPVVSEPKEGTSSLNKPKVYYKFINLYRVLAEKQLRNLGQYVIGLVTSTSNGSEVLVYQSKKNILIRQPINSLRISTYNSNDFSLLAVINEDKWVFEFDEADFIDFLSIFSSLGGMIRDREDMVYFMKKESPLLGRDAVLSNLKTQTLSTILDSVEVSNQESTSINQEIVHDDDKTNILSRLAKLGLPQLPYFQKDGLESEVNIQLKNDSDVRKGNSLEKSSHTMERGKDFLAQEQNESDGNLLEVKQYNNPTYDHINTLPILGENKFLNAGILKAITKISSEFGAGCTIYGSNKKIIENQLKSKLKAFEMKCENLEAELSKIKIEFNNIKEYENLQSKCTSKYNTTDVSCQTDEYITDNNCSTCATNLELLSFIKNFQIDASEVHLNVLKEIQSNIKDEELHSSFKTTIEYLEEKAVQSMNSSKKKRHNFAKEVKSIMLDLYAGVIVDQSEDYKNSIASQIRHATTELLKTYDTLEQKNKGKML